MYNIPDKVNVSFPPETMPRLQDRIYRIIWTAISIGHIRDQYFADNVSDVVETLNKRNPQTFVDFMKIIESSPLRVFGIKDRETKILEYPVMTPDPVWWLQVWQRLQDGGIELVQKAKGNNP